jgi:hypothetical protein
MDIVSSNSVMKPLNHSQQKFSYKSQLRDIKCLKISYVEVETGVEIVIGYVVVYSDKQTFSLLTGKSSFQNTFARDFHFA